MTRAESYVEELQEYQRRAVEVTKLLRPEMDLDEEGLSAWTLRLIPVLLLIDVRSDLRLLMTK